MDLNVTWQSLALSFGLVLIAMTLSYREGLGNIKEMAIAVIRAVIQLIIVGYVLTSLFNLNNTWVTLAMVAVIGFNAAYHAYKRSKDSKYGLRISLIAIFTSLVITLSILVITKAIEFIPSQVVPISGMIAGNGMSSLGLMYRNMGNLFKDQRSQIEEKLSLGATPKQASKTILSEALRMAVQPQIDSAKTIGIVHLPGMMSGLMFAGTVPTTAIMYQIMVTFMMLSTVSLSTFIGALLTYQQYFNKKQQFVL